jgi:hypothetical protein
VDIIAFRSLPVLVFTALLGACHTTNEFSTATPMRAGNNLPSRFEPVTAYYRVAPADTLSGAGCVSPIRDPRDGTELRMVRSGRAQGDYAVPAGQYGVAHSELLRIDCNTGEPLGIVQRKE